VAFEVTGPARYAKAQFPTDAVFGPVTGPVLRLITCGGAFDGSSGHYLDNLVVTARWSLIHVGGARSPHGPPTAPVPCSG
jgi:hypothetical protein